MIGRIGFAPLGDAERALTWLQAFGTFLDGVTAKNLSGFTRG